MSTVSAAARVLGLPELLEMIFLNLSPVDLFAMRRVNHDFLNTLNSYASLRERMHRELGGWDFTSLCEIILDPRLDAAIAPFQILALGRGKLSRSKTQRSTLLLTLDETWVRANQNTPVRTLFTMSLLRNIEGSWGLIGITKPDRAFKIELSVAGKVWGLHTWNCPGDDSLRLYEIIHKCMHMVSRGWKKGWQMKAIGHFEARASYVRKLTPTQTWKVREVTIKEVEELKKMGREARQPPQKIS